MPPNNRGRYGDRRAGHRLPWPDLPVRRGSFRIGCRHLVAALCRGAAGARVLSETRDRRAARHAVGWRSRNCDGLPLSLRRTGHAPGNAGNHAGNIARRRRHATTAAARRHRKRARSAAERRPHRQRPGARAGIDRRNHRRRCARRRNRIRAEAGREWRRAAPHRARGPRLSRHWPNPKSQKYWRGMRGRSRVATRRTWCSKRSALPAN